MAGTQRGWRDTHLFGLATVCACAFVFAFCLAGCSSASHSTEGVTEQTELEVSDVANEESTDEAETNSEHADSSDEGGNAEEATLEELWAALDITESYYDEFVHGEKGAEYQKYIVLHDTEGTSDAASVVSWWASNGNLIAAHFVINKDGSIVQCVDMDKIAHHAGWGSDGNNEKYGVTDESRDDKLGQKSTTTYSDYGMNSYSIGIEMVHQTGEADYPEAQLEALDNLIAYIDAYYGFESEIIDHKMWRAGNSDTTAEFADYLANYQDHRTHD